MIGSSLGLALVEKTPDGKKFRSEALKFYKQVNAKLAAGSYFHGSPAQLSSFHGSLSRLSEGDPLSGLTEGEKSLGESYRFLAGALMQELRAGYIVLGRRVRSTYKDASDIEETIKSTIPSAFALSIEFDPSNAGSVFLARFGTLLAIRSDLMFAMGVTFTAYREERIIVPPFLTNPFAVNQLTREVVRDLKTMGYYKDISVKKYRIDFDGKSYIHPVITAQVDESAADGILSEDTLISYYTLDMLKPERVSKLPKVKKVLTTIFDYTDELSQYASAGRELDLGGEE